MNETAAAFVAMFCAINPAAFAHALSGAWVEEQPRQRQALIAAGAVAAFVGVAVLALLADPVLDGLDLAQESYRIALGTVFAVGGARTVLFGPLRPPVIPAGWAGALVPVAFPLMLGAEAATGAIGFAVDSGIAKTLAAAAVALVVAVVLAIAVGPRTSDRTRFALGGLARLLGAVLILVGAGLVIDGVRDV